MGFKLLVAMETSGVVRDAFLALGVDAISADVLPTQAPGPHIQGDVRNIQVGKFDGMICHPTCTYLTSSGLHWNHRVPGRAEKTEEALDFVRWLMAVPVHFFVMENPVGRINTAIRKPDQIIQPYQFGEDASKATCLWLRNLPLLKHATRFPGRWVTRPDGKRVERWSNQTDSGQNRLGPSENRWQLRSKTYLGIAKAMASQWAPIMLSYGQLADRSE